MREALAKEQEDHAITKKANKALKKKYCDLDEKHKELEEQYSILWDSNSHPSKSKDTSTPSTSQGCGKCYNLDLNAYSTNLANMEAMRKGIARLNEIIVKGCMDGKTKNGSKTVEEQKGQNTRMKGIPQSKMGLGTQKELKPMGKS